MGVATRSLTSADTQQPPQVGPSPSPCHPGGVEVGAVYSLIRRWVLSRGSADLGEREEGNSLPVLWPSRAHLTPLESNTLPAPGHRGHVQPDILSTYLCQVLGESHRGLQHTPHFQRVSSLQVPINEGKTCKTSGEDQSLSSREHPRRPRSPAWKSGANPLASALETYLSSTQIMLHFCLVIHFSTGQMGQI